MSSHDSNDVSSNDLRDRIEACTRTELITPIKVKWSGTTRSGVEECEADLDNPQADLFCEASNRLASKLEIRTAEEATAVLCELSRYGAGRSWIDAGMVRSIYRVQQEIADALRERGYTVEQSDRGLYTVLAPSAGAGEESELLADGGQRTCGNCGEPITHTTCAGPGETRNSCGCRVSPDTLVTDGGVPENFEELVATCESCGSDVEPRYLEDGECPGCVYGEPVADGGVTWADLHAFKRDCLEAIRRLNRDGETTYGLAIKAELEHLYGEEVNHGRLYPNLDDLVEVGLLEKSELDKRTNEYELTDAAEAMLEERARLLADACGMEQPVADGGESA